MKKILIVLVTAILLVPTIVLSQGMGSGLLSMTQIGDYTPFLTLVASKVRMDYKVTTENTGNIPFSGIVLVTLSGKTTCEVGSDKNIPGNANECWGLSFPAVEGQYTTVCGGSPSIAKSSSATVYQPGDTQERLIYVLAPDSVPAGRELTLMTKFFDANTMNLLSIQCDDITTTTPEGKIMLEFLQLFLTGMGAALTTVGFLAFVV